MNLAFFAVDSVNLTLVAVADVFIAVDVVSVDFVFDAADGAANDDYLYDQNDPYYEAFSFSLVASPGFLLVWI